MFKAIHPVKVLVERLTCGHIWETHVIRRGGVDRHGLGRIAVVESIRIDGGAGPEEQSFKVKVRIQSPHHRRRAQTAPEIHIVEVVSVKLGQSVMTGPALVHGGRHATKRIVILHR
jgi:hypothetical protein